MNSLTREILGLGLKGNKLGAPRYYELSEGQKDAVAYTIGVGAFLTAEEYEKRNRAKSDQEKQKRKEIDDAVRAQRELLKNDTWDANEAKKAQAEKVSQSKPVEKTPADPKAGPRPPKVSPSDVSPRNPDQDPDR
jgi:hypothetical protein